MSLPRPIHQPQRELRSQPDENEPSHSYEDRIYIPPKEEEHEQEYFKRTGSGRRESSGSFWRESKELNEPNFASMSMQQRQESIGSQTGSFALEGLSGGLQFHLHDKEAQWQKPDYRKDSAESKKLTKQRSKARRMKMEAQNSDLDLGHLDEGPLLIPPTEGSISRSSSDHSGSLIYGKTLHPARNGMLLGKSSSLIFPTGVDTPGEKGEESENSTDKRRRINAMLNQCEAVRFPFKRKLVLENMGLNSSELPIKDLVGTPLGNTLHKLSFAGNRLTTIPAKLVLSLPTLKHLDLSQCDLVVLPAVWKLPQLKRLNLSHNRLSEFPEEGVLEGLPELQELNMYGNKVSEIIIPRNPKLLSRLESLNLGYNDLSHLPEELDQLKALRTLKLQNNFLPKIPMRICDMELKTIDVASNPVVQPPMETCERGICSMKRYYHCLKMEEQSKHKTVETLQKKLQKDKKNGIRKRFLFSSSKSPSSASFNSQSTRSAEKEPELAVSSSLKSVEQPVALASKLDRKNLVRLRSRSFDDTVQMKESNSISIGADLKSPHPESPKVQISSVSAPAKSEPAVLLPDETFPPNSGTVNDTLKVIFVGMAMAGKTTMIKRLIDGRHADIPKRDDRTIGVDIYEWDPQKNKDRASVDTRIDVKDQDVNVKFSVWDFAGQHVYHATHELFFSNRALYVIVWDMGATNQATFRRKSTSPADEGAFKLSYDSSDEESESDDFAEEEIRRADRALEKDIDEKVQFWVECIQSCAPGSAIIPVASNDDYFAVSGETDEAQRRCRVLRERLLKHEERRIAGIQGRYNEYIQDNRADEESAVRLRNLLCSWTRPKLIFGDENDPVVRVSGTEYTGFEELTQKIVRLAVGHDKAGHRYSLFNGHIGARIPAMRLQVRDAVRQMRDRFKVVEWGYFVNKLKEDLGLTNVDDIGDALHFLTNIGELSYFGNLGMSDMREQSIGLSRGDSNQYDPELHTPAKEDYVMIDEPSTVISMEDTLSTTMATSMEDGSISTQYDEVNSAGLSQYVFLNPRWLVAAVACILRHDLEQEIRETRRSFSSENRGEALENRNRHDSFNQGNLNYPVITAEDALMLWQAKKFTKKAAERAQEYSNNMQITPFDFLQKLLVRFGVFVPIDLTIDKALLGGREYAKSINDDTVPPIIIPNEATENSPQTFFLPSLLGPGEPSEAWTYKNTDSWKTTLCHSVLFPDGVPPGLTERMTASVLSSVYAAEHGREGIKVQTINGGHVNALGGAIHVKEILCWRSAFFLKLGTHVKTETGEAKESTVEIFATLADHESPQCVGSAFMGPGMSRLILSAKGQVGDGGRKIWKGGYMLVLKSIQRVMKEYGGLEYEKQAFCPECLSKKSVSEASYWDFFIVKEAAKNGDASMHCSYGHRVDIRLITGQTDLPQNPAIEYPGALTKFNDSDPVVGVNDLLKSVVLVGLWDGKNKSIVRAGSGFIVDKKRGLIVTASHTLMNIWGDKNFPFGENYYGLSHGKVVIGVIPEGSTEAVFRYFAKIVTKDPSIEGENRECHLDACVLRITTRLEEDVGGNGDDCGDKPETLLLNNPRAMKKQDLQHLKVTDKCELDEQVRILGFNQGGEGFFGPGESLSRYVDIARGYVCKKFATGEDGGYLRHRFKPKEEIVVICPTIGGHSGGPCVNQQGEVIGILSRADPAESHRCYLAPSSQWKKLVKDAKNAY